MRVLLAGLLIVLITSYSCNQHPKVLAKTLTPTVVESEQPDTNEYGLKINLEDVAILKERDEIEGKTYYYASQFPIFSAEGNSMKVIPAVKVSRGKVVYNDLIVITTLTGCTENDKLYILFEDGTRETLKSWQKFNCNNTSYFDFDGTYLNKLAKPIKSIKFENGRNYESFVYTLKNEEKNYFINFKNAIDKQKIIEKSSNKS